MNDTYFEDFFNEDMTSEEIVFACNVEIKKALEDKNFDLVNILQEKLNDYLAVGEDNE